MINDLEIDFYVSKFETLKNIPKNSNLYLITQKNEEIIEAQLLGLNVIPVIDIHDLANKIAFLSHIDSFQRF